MAVLSGFTVASPNSHGKAGVCVRKVGAIQHRSSTEAIWLFLSREAATACSRRCNLRTRVRPTAPSLEEATASVVPEYAAHRPMLPAPVTAFAARSSGGFVFRGLSPTAKCGHRFAVQRLGAMERLLYRRGP